MYSCIPLLLPKWGNNVGSNLNLGRNSLAPSHYPAFENERDALSPPDAFWDKLYPKKHPPFFFLVQIKPIRPSPIASSLMLV